VHLAFRPDERQARARRCDACYARVRTSFAMEEVSPKKILEGVPIVNLAYESTIVHPVRSFFRAFDFSLARLA